MNIKKILVPVDDSTFALKTAEAACQLAHTLQATVCMLHVVDPAILAIGAETVVYPITEVGALLEGGNKLIADINEKLKTDVRIESHVLEGVPSEIILNQAKVWQCDLIVMGTHGRTGLSHLIMGSVAENVVRHSNKPVLIIPGKS
ncbi:MAG: universal stress protein [Bacteroidia bacterium]|nr:universal stress protein [Bacteroidia bacterium]HQU99561.1 universal stress protein [Bacteroidia bacterium]